MSNSYTFDPSVGEAIPTSEISNNQTNATDSTEVDFSQALQNREDASIRNTVEALSRRQDKSGDVGGSNNPEGEQELLGLQRELSQAEATGDFLKIEALSAKCEALAHALVTGQQAQPDPIKEAKWNSAKQDAEDQIKQDDAIQAALDYAAENLNDDQIDEWNNVLTKGSATDRQLAAEALTSYKNNPEYFTDTHQELDESSAMAIVDFLGKEQATEIITLSAAVACGVAKPSDALKVAAKSPALMKNLKACAAQGLIRIKL